MEGRGTAQEEEDEKVYIPLKKRRLFLHHRDQSTLARVGAFSSLHPLAPLPPSQPISSSSVPAPASIVSAASVTHSQRSLVDIALEVARTLGVETQVERDANEEAFLLSHLHADRAPLVGMREAALMPSRRRDARQHPTKGEGEGKGEEPEWELQAVDIDGWSPSSATAHALTEEQIRDTRAEFSIRVDGDSVPAPCRSFAAMRLPHCIRHALVEKGIVSPTPIQMQGLPVVLQGRDMIGIALTGSGKTLVFSLPLILRAWKAECGLPFQRGEGPVGLIVCPSRELARQHADVLQHLADCIRSSKHDGAPVHLRILLAIGGLPISEQIQTGQQGVHIVVATPGRLLDILNKGKLSMVNCEYLALDEADRLIDLGFEEDIRAIFDHHIRRRQTVLFSATMPKKIQEFALSALVNPALVNVGRAGAASQTVVQEVEYVKLDQRLAYLLECLQKTVPPVLVFASHSGDVDEIHEYLLMHGVSACAIHGSMAQKERLNAISQFMQLKRDVLVATDVASKGLDFPAIQHVINYDMPKEIEDYVHRIGRTGRRGNTGIATTFVHRDINPMVLQDLKSLLVEAKQKIPPILANLPELHEAGYSLGGEGCAYCGGLGHRLLECPKLAMINRSKQKQSDYGYDFAQNDS